jgi:diacylglycerol kinase (CTP)
VTSPPLWASRVTLRPLHAHDMAMTPANDAFTLNNRYSHNHSRRSPRPSTRSPSPTAVAMGIGKLTRRNPRRLSHSGSNGNILHDIGEDAIHTLETRQYDEDEDTHPLKKQKVKKIDWEIPRKTFHSSIGVFVFHLSTRSLD